MNFSVPFVLASQSPRRRHLLALLDVDFEIQASDVDESVEPGLPPFEVARSLAIEKASAVANSRPASLVLGADTIVLLENTILNKPQDDDEARSMLRRLSGQTHTVVTGIALVHQASRRVVAKTEATLVTFAPLTGEEIDSYVATGSPLDKAGAYGIQDDRGALYIERIDGDYYNVVGLPLHRLYTVLKSDFKDLLV
ncbi:MAG: Maf family protein [Rhodothermales bacterium]